MAVNEAVELSMEERGRGRARLAVVTESRTGERFVIEIEGPEDEVRAEARYLSEQYHLPIAV
jgi:hypothetical protein